MGIEIRELASEADLRAAWPVVMQLRPHLDEARYIAAVQRLRAQAGIGYGSAAVFDDGAVASYASWRVGECLAWGRFVYVDDLVTDEARRGRGHGRRMMAWLIERARSLGCGQVHLDSGVQRFAAHRLYLGCGMVIQSHHFAMDPGKPGEAPVTG